MISLAGGLSPLGIEGLLELLLGSTEADVLVAVGKGEAKRLSKGGEHSAELFKNEAKASVGNLVLDGGNDVLLNKGGYRENWGHDGGDNGTSYLADGFDNGGGDLGDCVKDVLEKACEIPALLDSERLCLDNDEDKECAQSDLSEFHLFSIFNII